MPDFYLVLDKDSHEICAQDTKPAAPYTKVLRHHGVFNSNVDLACTEDTSNATLNEAATLFEARVGRSALIRDVKSAVHQLQQFSGNDGCGYIALGGSPKLVKWAMKARGFNIVTVNASKVKMAHTRTDEFTAYLTRKLRKLGSPNNYVVLDFADTGDALRRIKADITELIPTIDGLSKQATVQAVAVGTSVDFNSPTHPEYKLGIDHILAGIPDLSEALEKQTLKIHILGRNKVINPYANWSAATAGKLDETSVIGKSMSNTALYQQQKKLLPKALEMDVLEIKFAQVFDADALAAVAGGDGDSDGSEGDLTW